MDLLAEDFLSEEANLLLSKKDKIAAFCWVLLGGKITDLVSVIASQLTFFNIALGMSIVGAFA